MEGIIHTRKFKEKAIINVKHNEDADRPTYPYVMAIDTDGEPIPMSIIHLDKFNFTVILGFFGEPPKVCSGSIFYRY